MRRQTELARAWCVENKIEFVENYRDLGISAFRGKNAATGALAAFLAKVEAEVIPTGSILVVESLDRLTRNRIVDALTLFLSLIRAGVEVVTLSDGKRYSETSINANFTELIISLTVLARGHEESAIKSMRNGAAWDRKRQDARSGKIMSAKGPSWLKLRSDRAGWEVIPEKADAVLKAFEMARTGLGQFQIAKALNESGVPVLKRGKWHPGTIYNLLRDRTVIGELQMRRNVGPGERKSEVVGTIPGYYPAILDEATFAQVQRIHQGRATPKHRGRKSSIPNPFRGYLRDETGGSVYARSDRRQGRETIVRLAPSSCFVSGRPWVSWRLDDFTKHFLALVRVAAVAERPRAATPSDTLAARVDDLTARIENLVKLLAVAFTEEGARELARIKEEREKARRKLADARTVSRASESLSAIPWDDAERLAESVARTVRVVEVDFETRSFKATLLNGETYALLRRGDAFEVVVDGGASFPADLEELSS